MDVRYRYASNEFQGYVKTVFQYFSSKLCESESLRTDQPDMLRISRPEVLCKKAVFKNSQKHLCQGLLEACNFIKKEALAQVFSVNFAKFLRFYFEIFQKFFIEHHLSGGCF